MTFEVGGWRQESLKLKANKQAHDCPGPHGDPADNFSTRFKHIHNAGQTGNHPNNSLTNNNCRNIKICREKYISKREGKRIQKYQKKVK